MFFELPPLPYGYKALEPYIDTETMKIHHTKHHNGYVVKLNDAIKGLKLKEKTLEELLMNISSYNPAVRNNAGGHWNHSLFWKIMSPKGGGKPKGKLLEMIIRDFKTYEKFKEEFEKAAASRFGSGWAWLCLDSKKKLFVTSTPNQDNPLMDDVKQRGTPILGLDVWEHAYYLKYQNRRPDYISAFWHVVSWTEVENNLERAMK